jgi:hypothetical protein
MQTPNTYEVLIAMVYGDHYPYTYPPSWFLNPDQNAVLASFFDSILYMNRIFRLWPHRQPSNCPNVPGRCRTRENPNSTITFASTYPTAFSVFISGEYFYITPKSLWNTGSFNILFQVCRRSDDSMSLSAITLI